VEQTAETEHCPADADPYEKVTVAIRLLGPFAISLDGKTAGPWPRPSGRRLCELLMLRPDHRLVKEAVREMLFPNLPREASAHALSKALSMARQALRALGDVGPWLLRTGRDHIYVPADARLEIDLVRHQGALRRALAMEPGTARDAALSAALLEEGLLLDDEPYSDWALEARNELELLRQRARLELARDRTNGHGWTDMDAIVDAWEMCLAHDLASEEVGISLMRAYAWRGERQLVVSTYRRCRKGLEKLGLEPSSTMEKSFLSALNDPGEPTTSWPPKVFERTATRASLRGLGDGEREEAERCPMRRAPALTSALCTFQSARTPWDWPAVEAN
jgi:DNA-binding SARP family transcriptional activator